MKRRILVILVAVLTVVFLFFLHRMTLNAYDVGGGLSYLSELERSGLELGSRTTSKAHEKAAEASEMVGLQYAALTAFSFIVFFGAFLVVIGYGFGLTFLGTRRALFSEVILTGMASLTLGGATLFIGKSIRSASQVGLGIWVATALLFTVLISIVWGVRRFLKSRQAINIDSDMGDTP